MRYQPQETNIGLTELMNLLGQNKTLLQISAELNMDFWSLHEILEKYKKAGVIRVKF